jgi:hypothetical protein
MSADLAALLYLVTGAFILARSAGSNLEATRKGSIFEMAASPQMLGSS